MDNGYFKRVKATTPTRLWLNNPTSEEVSHALEQGAVGCTTNPAFAGNLLRRAPAEVMPILLECARSGDTDQKIAGQIQHLLASRVVHAFSPLYEASDGREGFVSIQGNPLLDNDSNSILQEAEETRGIGPNATPKIPATAAGIEAFEVLVAEGSPTIVTEVFSLSQLIDVSSVYLRVSEASGLQPPFFIAPITGIFGDHLRSLADRDGIQIDRSFIDWAGVSFARACYREVVRRSIPATLLFGGARTTRDFTGLVGAPTASTINYSTVTEILELDPVVEASIFEEMPTDIAQTLERTFEDFRLGMRLDGLSRQEFADFGPVQHFRANFVAGWQAVVDAIHDARGDEARRKALESGGRLN